MYGVTEPDHDAEFERIIAGWDAVAPEPTPRQRLDPALDLTSGVGPETRQDPTGDAPAGVGTERPDPDVEPNAAEGSVPGPVEGLVLPIAPGTGHVWRSAPRPHDDDDVVLAQRHSDDHDGDHFVPPTDTDLPSAEDDPMYWAIVVGLAGGPLLMLYIVLFDRDGSGWWVVTAVTMIVVGFVLLVLRGGTERDPSDDGTRV